MRGWAILAELALLAAGWSVLPLVASNPPLVLTQVPVRSATSPVPPERAGEFEGARLLWIDPDGTPRVISTAFDAACDPEVSPDAQRLLFAAKQMRGEPWSLWELELESGATRLIYRERSDCRSPRYLSSLFTLDSPEPWSTVLFLRAKNTLAASGRRQTSQLCTLKLDGTELRELTCDPGHSLDPVQLRDGRVLYSGTRHALAPFLTPERSGLFAVHIDGMDQELYGGQAGRRLQRMPCPTTGDRVVFVETDADTWDGAGQLAWVRDQRPLHTYTALTQDAQWRWLYPAPWEADTILVSRRPAAGSGSAGVFRLDLRTAAVEPVWDSPEYHDLQAQAVQPRPLPDGRSTVVDHRFRTGKLYGLDCALADPRLQPYLAPGVIQRLRVIEGVPLPLEDREPAGDPMTAALGLRLLGEAPVEPDGSFQIQIPADIPVRLQALDDQGLALATCGWIWVKPRENRGCIGCHEDPELIPENRFVSALARPATQLTLPPERRRSVGFREHVVPILSSSCALADCHGGSETPLNLGDLGVSTTAAGFAYERLLAPATDGVPPPVRPGQARASLLAWRILGRDVSRPWDRPPDTAPLPELSIMPPPTAVPLTELERRTLLEWIDLGAPWKTPQPTPSTSATPHSPDEDETR